MRVSALTGATIAAMLDDPGVCAIVRTLMLEAEAVGKALGVRFAIDVERRIEGAREVGEHRTSMLQDLEAYKKYRRVLLAKYPKKEGMGWPTYLLVTDPDGDFTIKGEIKGGSQKGEFRSKLQALLDGCS